MIKLNTKIRRNEGLPPFEENNLMRNTSFLEGTRSIIPRFRQTKSSCLSSCSIISVLQCYSSEINGWKGKIYSYIYIYIYIYINIDIFLGSGKPFGNCNTVARSII